MIHNLKPITANSKKQITNFWNFFKINEREIINALFLGINGDGIYALFNKKFNSISKMIGFEITKPHCNQDKCRILFTAYGRRKLFPKIIALENQAPLLEHFTVQAFIKPFENIEEYKNGTDDPTFYSNYNLKISDLQMTLADYDIETKQIKMNVYLPEYNEIKHFDDLEHNIEWIVMQIIGEIAFGKHIKKIILHQMPLEPIGLLSLVELQDFISYLCQINAKWKTRKI